MTMPHVNSGGSDDIYGNSDEVKVYRDEGDEENEKRSSENLSEDKLGLVTETEEVRFLSIYDVYTLFLVLNLPHKDSFRILFSNLHHKSHIHSNQTHIFCLQAKGGYAGNEKSDRPNDEGKLFEINIKGFCRPFKIRTKLLGRDP